MNVKTKYETAKVKLKKYAPAMVAGGSLGVAIALSVILQRVRIQHADTVERFVDYFTEDRLVLSSETISKLADGESMIIEPPFDEDLRLIVSKYETPEEDPIEV